MVGLFPVLYLSVTQRLDGRNGLSHAVKEGVYEN